MSLHHTFTDILPWVFFSGILIGSISFLELLWPFLVVLSSGSIVLYSFGGVFWKGHKPEQSFLGPGIKEPQHPFFHYSFIFANGFRSRRQGLWCSHPSFPFILLLYDRRLRKWGNIADLRKLLSVWGLTLKQNGFLGCFRSVLILGLLSNIWKRINFWVIVSFLNIEICKDPFKIVSFERYSLLIVV